MFNSKYSSVLTVLLVIIIIAIIGIIGFLGYRFYKSSTLKNNSEDFVDSFLNDSNINKKPEGDANTEVGDFEDVEGGDNTGNTGSSNANVEKFNGFTVAGSIEIPATNLKSPIIARAEYSKSAWENAIVEIYGPGLNQVGNTTLAGHNYRNGNFFSNNKKLNIGDKIYITDLSGQTVEYTVYNKYITPDSDGSYIIRDTQGRREISLSTCTSDVKQRLVIWASAD